MIVFLERTKQYSYLLSQYITLLSEVLISKSIPSPLGRYKLSDCDLNLWTSINVIFGIVYIS